MDATDQLFDRIPDTLFRSLGGQQPRLHWALLHRLYVSFFAPEAPIPQGDGWLFRDLTAAIEGFLREWDRTHPPSDEGEAATPLSVRAAGVLALFREHGWFADERVGYARYVVMRPTVQSLFELLKGFSESGPEFIGGRIQVIRSMVQATRKAPGANAAGFHTAARECSALLRMLNTLRLRIKEASEAIRREADVSLFVQGFFEDYIGRLYIGDYREMFSRNHPLHHRWEIVELVDELRDDPDYVRQLTAWYAVNLRAVSPEHARQLLEDDFERFAALSEVEPLMERLKATVARANDEALGYLRYRMRVQGAVEAHVDRTIDAIRRSEASRQPDSAPTFAMGWSTGIPLSEQSIRLREPAARARVPSPIVRRVVSPEVQARRLIRQIMRDNRLVSPQVIEAYLDSHFNDRTALHSNDMAIDSINDLCVFAALTRVSMLALRTTDVLRANRFRDANHPYAPLLQRYRIVQTGERFVGVYVDTPAIEIHLIAKGAHHAS